MVSLRSTLSSSLAVIVILAGFICVCQCSSSNASAQTYRFSVEYERLDVYVLKDGSIDIYYYFGFINYGYLDGVDIGLPNKYYDLDSAEATIIVDGQEYAPAQIRESPYVDIGVAVEFTSTVMQLIDESGTAFQLEFYINNPRMVHENELVEGTVGIAMKPTWFSSAYQIGAVGELTARVFFPEGFEDPSKAVYLEGQPWDAIGMDTGTGLLVATWTATDAYPSSIESGVYDFGAGFPAEFVDSYEQRTIWDAVTDFFSSLADMACVCAPVIFIAGFVFVLYMMDRAAKARIRNNYFSPSMQLVGVGPRRDLTAVEAAVVLERPLEVVATMILFGLVKKGMVRIDSDEKPMRLTKLATKGEYSYETGYLEAISADGRMNSERLKASLIILIKATELKLQGFSYESTKEYYSDISSVAWRQVKEAGTPEEFASGLSKHHEWMMLDEGYDNRMRSYFVGVHHHYVPYRYFVFGRTSSAKNVSPQQLASDYASSVRSAGENVVSNFKSLAYEVAGRTNPAPKFSGPSSSRGSYLKGAGGFGGIGGGGCACACACACAGGGR